MSDLVVLGRTQLKYNYTRTTGRNAQRKTVPDSDLVQVIYSANKKTGSVTVYKDDGRALPGQTPTVPSRTRTCSMASS